MKYEVWPDVEVRGGRGRFSHQLVVLVDTLRSTGLSTASDFTVFPLLGEQCFHLQKTDNVDSMKQTSHCGHEGHVLHQTRLPRHRRH